jgi:predicted DNA-binding transcriptional regulator AlpA
MQGLISKKKVCELLSIAPATLARWEADPQLQFPKRFHIGGNGVWKKAFWRADEVLAWIDKQTAREAPTEGS